MIFDLHMKTLKKKKPFKFIGDQNDIFANNLSDVREDSILCSYFHFYHWVENIKQNKLVLQVFACFCFI